MNRKAFKFESDLIKLIENSELPLVLIHYILNNVNKDIDQLFKEQVNTETLQMASEPEIHQTIVEDDKTEEEDE